MSTAFVLDFAAPQATEQSVAGGKAINLARLTAAGFDVPAGFVVTTAAYQDFIVSNGLDETIGKLLAELNFQDAAGVESATERIRTAIGAAVVPEHVTSAILRAYRADGGLGYVAVRSSGTAEDLAEASFAGMHDTYLDVCGDQEILDGVKGCWASLWTARATSYRNTNGFDQLEARLAVVVQRMVESEVAGVMFTGNPLTESTDEIVINASWGLGEAVVSGVVTPDEYVVNAATLAVKRRTIGDKALSIVRDPDAGTGTRTMEVTSGDRSRAALDDTQIAELAALGRRISEHYDAFPQDIEWALVDGRFHVLQSRPITGVEFSWDSEVNSFQLEVEDDEVLWTRTFADEIWTGAITPLMFSVRGWLWQRGYSRLCTQLDLHDAAKMWMWKFHKSEAYYNTTLHRIIVEQACPPAFRPGLLDKLPAAMADESGGAPFSYLAYLRRYIKGHFIDERITFFKWLDELDSWPVKYFDKARGLDPDELARLSDAELISYTDRMIELEADQYLFLFPWFVYARDLMSLLIKLVGDWYDGDNPYAAIELMTGVTSRTITMDEGLVLWRLAERVRTSETLTAAMSDHQDSAFFDELENSEDGREFLTEYRDFVHKMGHRGHADRDFYFPRRSEDPAVDYRAIKILIGTPDPEIKEDEVNRRRDEVLDEVVANVRRKPFGGLKAEAIKYVASYALRFLTVRDNERSYADLTTYATKRGFSEISRRLVERCLLDSDRDFYFLTRDELYDLFRGVPGMAPALRRARIAARARDFDRLNDKEISLPRYLQHGRAVDADSDVDGADALQGLGTSRGTVTGTARVVKGLHEIDQIRHGDILICNSTDPGWTPVFFAASAIVAETGGMLAHFSCLSREHGLPAIQLANAMQLIPNGATITVNGDTGTVVIDEPAADTVPA